MSYPVANIECNNLLSELLTECVIMDQFSYFELGLAEEECEAYHVIMF